MNSAEFTFFSAKFRFLNMLIKNNFKNVILIASKWCKIFKYSVNSMVISDSYCQKEEKECIWVKYLIYTVLSRFQICRNSRVFSAKSETKNFRVDKKMFFFQVCYSSVQFDCTAFVLQVRCIIFCLNIGLRVNLDFSKKVPLHIFFCILVLFNS